MFLYNFTIKYVFIVACGIGFYGFNCSKPCRYPNYGVQCQHNCGCSETFCNNKFGCPEYYSKVVTKSTNHGTTLYFLYFCFFLFLSVSIILQWTTLNIPHKPKYHFIQMIDFIRSVFWTIVLQFIEWIKFDINNHSPHCFCLTFTHCICFTMIIILNLIIMFFNFLQCVYNPRCNCHDQV